MKAKKHKINFSNLTKDEQETAALAYKMAFHVLDIAQIILPIYENIFSPVRGTKMRLNAVYSSITGFEQCLKNEFIAVNNTAEELNMLQEENDEIFEVMKTYCSISLSKTNRKKLNEILTNFNKENELARK